MSGDNGGWHLVRGAFYPLDNAFLNQNAWNVAMQWYSDLTLYAVLAMAVVLLFLAWQSSRAANEQDRAEAQKGMWRWVFGFLLLYLMPWFATAVFTVNGALVHFAFLHLNGINVNNSVATGNVLSDAIIALYMAGLKLYFNILYVVRAVFTLLLLAIAPIVIWTYVLNPTRQSFIMWSAELFSNIMMQAAHAITLSFFFAILTVIQGSAAGSGVSGILGQWWAKIVIITLVIPVGQFLRNLINMWLNVFGVKEEQLAAGATAGIAGIMGLPKVLGAVSRLKFGGAAAGLAGAGGAGLGGGTPGADAAGGGFNVPPGGGGGGSSAGAAAANVAGGGFAHAQNYNVAARAAATMGGILGATMGMPFGESRAVSMGGAALGRRLVSNIGQAHQALVQRGQGATEQPATAWGRAVGALVGGAAGGHVGAGVGKGVVKMGSQFLSGLQQGTEGPAVARPVGDVGPGGMITAPASPQSSSVEQVTGQTVSTSAPAEDAPSANQVPRPSASLKGDSARRMVIVENDNATGGGLLADRPIGLEDIIDFHRLM